MTELAWDRWTRETAAAAADRARGPDPAMLPSLRRGANRVPGAAPEMWPYYTWLDEQGRLTRKLQAEHVCLVAFGFHQQGKRQPVHVKGVRLGSAVWGVRSSGKFSEDAVDDRMVRLATAGDLGETSRHLLSLVRLMRSCQQHITLDYTQLLDDLTGIQYEDRIGGVRRRWGAAYFRPDQKE